MNIKKVSELTGVSADTIRYYERIGLIHPVQRNQHGVRVFDEEDLKWIHFARQMRQAGLSVESLTDYVSLFREGNHTIPARKELLREQIIELREKIDTLTSTVERLEYKLAHYDEHLNPYEQGLKNKF